MPSGAIQFFIISLCTGQSFGTEITIVWIITSIITSTILAIATPPIPGGGLSCYTILFAQLGIPSAGIALVISIELLMDAFLTACNLAFLQTELVLSAKKLNLLDEENCGNNFPTGFHFTVKSHKLGGFQSARQGARLQTVPRAEMRTGTIDEK